jgi:hypothetical protein
VLNSNRFRPQFIVVQTLENRFPSINFGYNDGILSFTFRWNQFKLPQQFFNISFTVYYFRLFVNIRAAGSPPLPSRPLSQIKERLRNIAPRTFRMNTVYGFNPGAATWTTLFFISFYWASVQCRLLQFFDRASEISGWRTGKYGCVQHELLTLNPRSVRVLTTFTREPAVSISSSTVAPFSFDYRFREGFVRTALPTRRFSIMARAHSFFSPDRGFLDIPISVSPPPGCRSVSFYK